MVSTKAPNCPHCGIGAPTMMDGGFGGESEPNHQNPEILGSVENAQQSATASLDDPVTNPDNQNELPLAEVESPKMSGIPQSDPDGLQALKIWGITLCLIGCLFMAVGFFKLWVYVLPEENEWGRVIKPGINAYVGGDAYNYTINAGLSTSYFVIALIFILFGSTLFIMRELRMLKKHG